MSCNQRMKGIKFERLIASKLREIFPEASRGIQGRDGSEAADVEIPLYWIECKHTEGIERQLEKNRAYNQALNASKNSGKIPIVIWRRSHGTKEIMCSTTLSNANRIFTGMEHAANINNDLDSDPLVDFSFDAFMSNLFDAIIAAVKQEVGDAQR